MSPQDTPPPDATSDLADAVPFERPTASPAPRPNGRDVLVGVTVLAVIVAATPLLSLALPVESRTGPWVALILSYALLLGWQYLWPWLVARRSTDRRFSWRHPWIKETGIGAIGFLVAFFATWILQFIWPMDDRTANGPWQVYVDAGATSPLIVIGVIAVVAVPVAEEGFFRGFLQRYLHRKTGVWIGVVTTSVLFSLYHTPELRYGVGLMVMGLVFGWLYAWRGSLIAPIACHAITNVIGFAFLIVAAAAAADTPSIGVYLDHADVGVGISLVVPESPADRAGLEVGESIISIDGDAVSGADQFVSRIYEHIPGDVVSLEIRDGRTGETRVVRVTVGRRGDVFNP